MLRGWLDAMLATSPERDEAQAQRYWRKRLIEHPEEVQQEARSGRAPTDVAAESPRRTMGEAVGTALLSVLLYVPGACLLGYGLGPGNSALLIVIGALMIAAGLPLRILAARWRRQASTQSPGPPASLRGD
jgi:hypothetical protein